MTHDISVFTTNPSMNTTGMTEFTLRKPHCDNTVDIESFGGFLQQFRSYEHKAIVYYSSSLFYIPPTATKRV